MLQWYISYCRQFFLDFSQTRQLEIADIMTKWFLRVCTSKLIMYINIFRRILSLLLKTVLTTQWLCGYWWWFTDRTFDHYKSRIFSITYHLKNRNLIFHYWKHYFLFGYLRKWDFYLNNNYTWFPFINKSLIT